MPLRFLQSKKDKHELMKHRCKSTTDLQEIRKILAPDINMVSSEINGIKIKSKRRLSLFSNSKINTHVSTKEAKKKKENNGKGSSDITEPKKRESITSLRNETENSQSTHLNRSDLDLHSNNDSDSVSTVNTKPPKRSASCCVLVETTVRERRMSDIAQLEQYIEYHQRRVADDGSNAQRLVCAQLLRQGFLKFEQTRQEHSLRPQDKGNLSRSMSNLNSAPISLSNNAPISLSNNAPISLSNNAPISTLNNAPISTLATLNHYQKNNVNKMRRWSQWSSPAHPNEHRLSVPNGSRRGSWASVDSDEKDEYAPIQFTCKPGIDLVENEQDYKRQPDTEDMLILRNFLKKPKFMGRRRSVPTLPAPEIEIF